MIVDNLSNYDLVFIKESQEIAKPGASIDLTNTKLGHVAAFLKSQSLGKEHMVPYSSETFEEWEKLIQMECPGTALTENGAAELYEFTRQKLNGTKRVIDDIEYCHLITDFFQKCHQLGVLQDGRLARLVVNYIATYYKRPILQFESSLDSINQFNQALEDKKTLFSLMVQKIKKAIIGVNGELLINSSNDPNNIKPIYESSGGSGYRQQVLWHKLAVEEKKMYN